MKKILSVMALLLLLVSHTGAQEQNHAPSEITILKSQLSQAKDDTVRIRLLTELANIFLTLQIIDSSNHYLSQAMKLVNVLIGNTLPGTNKKLREDYHILKAGILEVSGRTLFYSNTAAAIDTLKKALALRLSVHAGTGIGNNYFDIAYLYYVLLDHNSSDSVYSLSIAAYKAERDSSGMGMAYNWKAINLRDMGNFGDALENNLYALAIGKQIKDSSILTDAYLAMGFIYMYVNKYDDAIKNQQAALKIFISRNDSAGIATVFNDMGATNIGAKRYEAALANHQSALAIRKTYKEYGPIASSYNYIADIQDRLGYSQEALVNALEGLKYAKLDGDVRYISTACKSIGDLYLKLKDTANALKYYFEALDVARNHGAFASEAMALEVIANIYISRGHTAQATGLLLKALAIAPEKDYSTLTEIYKSLYTAYEKNNDYKNAFYTHIRYKEYSDSAAGKDKAEKLTTLTNQLAFENKQALLKVNNDKLLAVKQAELDREKLRRNFGFAGLFIVIVLAIIYFIRFREKRKLNVALEESLANLKATQSQLIQSEKMASLGELTAGIAHEIQNPLNFVNNFSDVNSELIEELRAELATGNTPLATQIADDIKENERKINHHGKRADGIVKSMLEHSRASAGNKQATDINRLADEYLRLSYHGLRAKDKSFSAEFKTEFDESIGKINVVTQDIGRVLLNLFNNAFYAVNEKARLSGISYQALAESCPYVPKVTVVTKKAGSWIEIKVTDNGNGIPQDIVDKIFQPFFTTKAAGQGTGLGLSLTYDIIKVHGGEIKVQTKEGEGSEFILRLPM